MVISSIFSKRPIFWAIIFCLALIGGGSLFLHNSASETKESSPESSETDHIQVITKKASELKTVSSEEHLPGIIAPEHETIFLATASGTIAAAPFEVGDTVSLGSVLFRIDTPFGSAITKDGLSSETIRQAEIAVSLAKKSYKDANRLAEKKSTKSVANTLARDLAKLRLESAEIALDNARNNSIIRSTFSGVISKKNASVGSAVSPGTELASIASTTTPTVRFSVSGNLRERLALGDVVSVQSGEMSSEAHITSIGALADSSTGKFPVEAKLSDDMLRAGTVATVSLTSEHSLTESDRLSLPLSATTTGQDGSFFFIEDSGIAKKVSVDSITVSGETGIVSANVPNDANIIVESGKALEEGASVDIKS
ncbi:MAG: efflux RND transporter periplasmic adaptor subunit [Candidatus Moraniibacteriota bacterium]|nr:MAG: efflux RND transporter periplasmic adaptor subunit [Candidatus Moranbacteria bacterium]